MDDELRAFLLGRAIEWAETDYGLTNVSGTIGENAVAEVYGDHVLAWEVSLTSEVLDDPIVVEVSIDTDGFVSVNRLENPKG